MPRVPVVPTLSTGTRPLATVQQRGVDPNPLGQLAGGVARVGDTLQRLAVIERQRADETRILEAENTLTSASTQLLTGFFEKRGKGAVGGAATLLEQFDKDAQGMASSLSDEQRRMLAPRLANMRQSLESGALRHEANEHTRYSVSTTKAAVGLAVEEGLADPSDAERLGRSVAKIEAGVNRLAELEGMSAEERDLESRGAVSRLLAGAVVKLVSSEDVTGAERLFTAVQGRLTAGDEEQARRAVTRGSTKVKSQQAFDALRKEFNGNTSQMREAAMARYSDDVRDMTMDYIREERSYQKAQEMERRQARAEAEQRQGEAIWTKVEAGQPLTQGEWSFLSRTGNRQRVEQRMVQRFNGTAPETNVAEWTKLQSMTDEEIRGISPLAYRGVLNESDYRQLVKRVNDAKSPNGPRTGAGTNMMGTASAMVLDAARDVGLVTARGSLASLPDDQRDAVYAFSSAVQAQVEQEEAALGRALKPTERAAVVESAKRQVLVQPGRIFGTRDPVLATAVAEDDDGDFRVPMARIPRVMANEYTEILTALAAQVGVASPRITPEMVERAAALRARGILTAGMTIEQQRAVWARVSR